MHDNPANDEYSWPTCTTPNCGRQLWVNETGRRACRPCEDQTVKRLGELPALFRRLNTTGALMRGAARGGGATSGSKTPPIPPRLEVLALLGPGGIATRLRDVEDAWRKALGWTVAPWRGSPAQAVPEHIRFLANNLPWACDAYESVGQDVEELRRLHAECTAADLNERRPGRVSIGRCPSRFDDGTLCAADLFATAASHRVRCGNCGSRWETLGEWKRLRQEQDVVLRNDARAAA
ncbi:hypothetical protein [Streptomyces poriferorum]|uniref:RanBP2-type domain-containing protein n=1 Tax=Streptomyces poriferorum TaxID=2798799 RepID=A0ABY9IZQ4_9ACTN|nr:MULTISPECIES: hypothetical protein [unclassified Streptomyces]MDP5310401.1 hypothetical protein [Streptomyces sp. Alt4]WLQ60445.1 hypothetical protein P8A19_35700 [Streptomyces sp. Alt2]